MKVIELSEEGTRRMNDLCQLIDELYDAKSNLVAGPASIDKDQLKAINSSVGEIKYMMPYINRSSRGED